MSKFKYIEEFEINASPKILYPYLDSPSGLQDWFCPKVNVDEDNIYTFNWDGKDNFARKTMHRLNKSVRFNFLDENKKDVEDPDYIDFQIETSELTQGQFLRVTDYSEENDEEELREMWLNMIYDLKSIIGG